MTRLIWYICAILGGYLLGSINMGAILARKKGFDIRSKGSGNAGASNALLTMGKKAAILTAVVDILKAFIPTLLTAHILPVPADVHYLGAITGTAVIVGHIFPFWMHFKGGKGFASLLGMTLALDWRILTAMLVILAVIMITTKSIALATILCGILLPVAWCLLGGTLSETAMFGVLAVIIFIKHIDNLKRIANHTEIGYNKE